MATFGGKQQVYASDWLISTGSYPSLVYSQPLEIETF